MQQYFFHLYVDGRLELIDEEGGSHESLDNAYLQAFDSAKELWAVLLRARRDPRHYSFRIANAKGDVLLELPFVEVLEACRPVRPDGSIRPRLSKKTANAKIVRNARQVARLATEVRQNVEHLRQSLQQSHDLRAKPPSPV